MSDIVVYVLNINKLGALLVPICTEHQISLFEISVGRIPTSKFNHIHVEVYVLCYKTRIY